MDWEQFFVECFYLLLSLFFVGVIAGLAGVVDLFLIYFGLN